MWGDEEGRGGYKMVGQASEVFTHRKRGMGKVLAILKGGGGTKPFGVVLTRVLEV